MPPEPLHARALETLKEALEEAGRGAPFAFETTPIDGAKLRRLASDDLSPKGGSDSGERPEAPTEISGLRLASEQIGSRHLILSPLVQPRLGSGLGREALMAVGHLRSHLPATEHGDIYLFLVPPPGPEGEGTWHQAARTIERNDRLCRTYVWLPSSNEADWPRHLTALLGRTFLAEPFIETQAQAKNLDPLRDALEPLSAATQASQLRFSPAELESWEAALTSRGPGGDLAQALIDALETNAHASR